MTTYRVNDDAVKQARSLVDSGDWDDRTEWSDAAPDTDAENRVIDDQGYEAFGRWHLAVDPDASEDTKGRFAFPYGDFEKVNRAAVIAAKQRASQNDHDAVEKAADELLSYLDERRG